MTRIGYKRVGHGGASALAQANTLESFEAAVDLGVDMIEFDVRASRGGELLLAHTWLDARLRGCLGLDAALRHLRLPRFERLELNLDLKSPGCEAAVVESLNRHGLLEKSLVSSQLGPVLDRLRRLDPRLRRGISIGGRLSRGRHRWGDWRTRVLDALRQGRFSALMAHHALVDTALVNGLTAVDAEVYAWTLSDRRGVERMSRLGVGGIVTGDPRLFRG